MIKIFESLPLLPQFNICHYFSLFLPPPPWGIDRDQCHVMVSIDVSCQSQMTTVFYVCDKLDKFNPYIFFK